MTTTTSKMTLVDHTNTMLLNLGFPPLPRRKETQEEIEELTQQEMLDFYHDRFSHYHTVQFSKDTLATAAAEAKKSSEACARVVTAKQNARNAGVCIDMAKQIDAFNRRRARLRTKLAK